MLATPLRRCIVTHATLPKGTENVTDPDFMLQIKPMIVPAALDAPETLAMLPDGILHPRFSQKKLGMGAWVTAHPFVIEQLHKKRMWYALTQKTIVFWHLMQFYRHIYLL